MLPKKSYNTFRYMTRYFVEDGKYIYIYTQGHVIY